MTEETLTQGNRITGQIAELRQDVRMIRLSESKLVRDDLGEELFKELKQLALERKDAEISKLYQEFMKL